MSLTENWKLPASKRRGKKGVKSTYVAISPGLLIMDLEQVPSSLEFAKPPFAVAFYLQHFVCLYRKLLFDSSVTRLQTQNL